MEGRALRNCLEGNFSEGASLPRWHVTRRKHRAGSWYPVPSTREGQKAVTVQGGYGALFAVRVQVL